MGVESSRTRQGSNHWGNRFSDLCGEKQPKLASPFFPGCLESGLDEKFCGRWKQELKNELRPHTTT